jgi:hypothetical protein
VKEQFVLNRPALLESMLDGTLHELEKEAGVVPYKIGEEEFDKLFFLVDGIYQDILGLSKATNYPLNKYKKRFASWQEAVRKVIEQAFGVLQARWQVLERSIHLHKPEEVAMRAICCFILHNMLVCDRLMNNNAHADYKPTKGFGSGLDPPPLEADAVGQPNDLARVQSRSEGQNPGAQTNQQRVETRHQIEQLQAHSTRGSRYRELIHLNESA